MGIEEDSNLDGKFFTNDDDVEEVKLENCFDCRKNEGDRCGGYNKPMDELTYFNIKTCSYREVFGD